VFGDVELRGGVRDLAVADVGAVQPHVEAGVDALEDQLRGGCGGVRGVVEVADVGAAGVVLGHVGRIEGNGVADVGVLVVVVSEVLPGAGHLDHGESLRGGVRGLPEGFGEVVDAGQVPEGPPTAEQVETVGFLPLPWARCGGGGRRHVIGAGRQRVFVEDSEVLEVSGNDHRSGSLKVDGHRGRAAVQRPHGDVPIISEILIVVRSQGGNLKKLVP